MVNLGHRRWRGERLPHLIKGVFLPYLKVKTQLKLLACFSYIASLLPHMRTPSILFFLAGTCYPSLHSQPFSLPTRGQKVFSLSLISNSCLSKQLHTGRCEQSANTNTAGPRHRRTCRTICCFFQTLRVCIQNCPRGRSCWARFLVTQANTKSKPPGWAAQVYMHHSHVPEPQGTDPSMSWGSLNRGATAQQALKISHQGLYLLLGKCSLQCSSSLWFSTPNRNNTGTHLLRASIHV